MAAPTPPHAVLVGTRTYRVRCSMKAWGKAVEKQEDAMLRGLTDHEAQTIALYPNMAADLTREVLLHEVNHCVTDVSGIVHDLDDAKAKLTEEQLVTRSSPVWLQVLRDNPGLVDFLCERGA